MFITKELLEKHDACKAQLDKFVELFPGGIAPTRALCLLHAQTFDFFWSRRLLSPAASKAHRDAIAPAWKAYYEAIDPAWEAYDEATTSAWKAYDEAPAVAWFDASQMELD